MASNAQTQEPASIPDWLKERFWSKVNKLADCWLWTDKPAKTGYGQLQARKFSTGPLAAHRLSWVIHFGPIPDELHVLHDCDVRLCVKPDHLFLGTQQDNNADRQRKGRTASGDRNGSRTRRDRNSFVQNGGSGLHGEGHPQARLTDAEVVAIRELYAQGTIKWHLARQFNVSATHIARIVNKVSR